MQDKNYRLLKDLPFAKAGEIFESRILDDGKEYMFWGEIKIQNIKNFDEWFEEIEEPKIYFTIDIYKSKFKEINTDYYSGWSALEVKNIKDLGLLFKTVEKTKKYLKYLKAKEIIKQDAKGFKPDWGDEFEKKYSGLWDNNTRKLDCISITILQTNTIYFKSRQDIEESFEKHSEEWKTYLTYEQ